MQKPASEIAVGDKIGVRVVSSVKTEKGLVTVSFHDDNSGAFFPSTVMIPAAPITLAEAFKMGVVPVPEGWDF